MSRAIDDVIAEHQKLIASKDFKNDVSDKHYDGGQLSYAAAAYADDAGWQLHEKRFGRAPEHADGVRDFGQHPPVVWPWDDGWKPYAPRVELIKAAAFIIAEIERLDRATPSTN